MQKPFYAIAVGLLLVVLGVLFLLRNFGYVDFSAELVVAFLFAAAALVFLIVPLHDKGQWWAFIPGFTLLGLALLVGLNAARVEIGAWGGALFLGAVGFSFCLVYLTSRENWWAVIPAGSLLTLAVVSAVSETLSGTLSGGIFFVGMGLTFIFVYFMPTPEGRMRWAVYPAVPLFALGFITLAAASRYSWPALLIVAGLFLVYRSQRVRGGNGASKP